MAFEKSSSKAWAYTQLSTGETCLRLYAQRYLFKTTKYVESAQMKEGKRQHKALQLRLADKNNAVPLPPDLAKLEPLCASIEKADLVYTEMKVAITRDFKPTGYWDDNGWQRGDVDLVAMGAMSTSAIALDWKTGDARWEQPFQLELYAVDLFAKFPNLLTIKVANVWLRDQQLGTPRTFTREHDMPRIGADMINRWANIERAVAANAFPATENSFCKNCDVLNCEFRRV